jgi:hypothetical protein
MGTGTHTPPHAASLMAEAGIAIETNADLLGHDGTHMALLSYRHATKPTVNAGNAGNAVVQHLSGSAAGIGGSSPGFAGIGRHVDFRSPEHDRREPVPS